VRRVWRVAAATCAASMVCATPAVAGDGGKNPNVVRAGKAKLEPPTLRSIGLEWQIEGDANRNARVEVLYREDGRRTWREGLPLIRLQEEVVPAENATDTDNANRPPEESAFFYTTPNMFSGSIFNLKPGTKYEVRLRLADRDGVKGDTEQTLKVTTRPAPHAYAGGRTFHVYPDGWTGPKQQPAFTGLLRAYNYGAEHADWNHAYDPRVRPGDTILVHAGDYKADRFEYAAYGVGQVDGPGYGVPFDGTYLLTGKGTADRPITIKAAGDGEVWFDGNDNHQLFNVQVADHHIFDGINIRNTNIAYDAGIRRIAGVKGLTVVNSRIEDVGTAVQTDYEGSRDFYIADNTIVGRAEPNFLLGRQGLYAGYPGFPALIHSFQAVRLYGPGHVVEYNRVERFHDGITMATYGRPDTAAELNPPRELGKDLEFDPRYVPGPHSVDVMNNDIYNTNDVCVEPDGGGRNIRVIANRCFNVTGQGMRSQPSFGPHYFIRNVIYQATGGNAIGASANGTSMVFYNNTAFNGSGSSGSNHHFRNNLFIGSGVTSPLIAMSTFTNYSSSDYNGFAPHPNQATQFRWTSPPFAVTRSWNPADLVVRNFPTLAAYQTATGQDRNSRLLTNDVFVNGPLPNVAEPTRLYDPNSVDLRLKPGSAAVDAGVDLPGVTDDTSGSAPDLGAYELGKPVPHYGPRG